MRLSTKEKVFLRPARIAHLATADRKAHPHVVPICYVFDGSALYSPIDEKPKRASPLDLKRIKNIRSNPHVAVIVDRYSENWTRLAYVLILGKARVLTKGKRHKNAVILLRRKYPQYRRMAIDERPMIQIRPTRIRSWGKL